MTRATGFPRTCNLARVRGLGARMVRALTEQLNASLEIVAKNPGVEFVVTAPLAP